MKKVVEKVSSLTEDFADELYYDREEIINDYSYDLGKEERNMEITKKLLDMKMPISNIIDITGLSEEEIKSLKN